MSRLRTALDALWVLGFVGVVVALLLGADGPSVLRSGVALELLPGGQRKVILRGGQRLGTVEHRVRRAPKGWWLEQRFFRGPEQVARAELRLSADLTLTSLKLEAELDRLSALIGGGAGVGIGASLLRKVLGGRVALAGKCDPQLGSCRVRGTIGGNRIDRRLTVGRGPVLPGAIYPLLARGVLGRKAELKIFDPLMMRSRVATYEVDAARREVRLTSGERIEALRVKQDVDGLKSEVWLDLRGRVMLERLPFGLSVEHLAFIDAGPPAAVAPRKRAER